MTSETTYPVTTGALLHPGDTGAASSTRMATFVDLLATRGHTFTGYADLWRWSVEDLEGFWGSVADHLGVRFHAPARTVVDDAGMPGTSWFPGSTVNYVEHCLGLPGGRGIKLRYSDPMLLDDVAADFPGLTIIMAHPSVPWQDSAISIATHKANVYIDLSGWSPKYFPPQLIKAANGLLKRKVLFGSDYPLLRPERWMADFETLDIEPEVKPLIFKENAIRALGLATDPLVLSSRPAG